MKSVCANFGRLSLALCILGLLLASKSSFACAVCGYGTDQTTEVFLYSTIALSLVPLGMMGSIFYWVYRQVKNHRTTEHAHHGSPT